MSGAYHTVYLVYLAMGYDPHGIRYQGTGDPILITDSSGSAVRYLERTYNGTWEQLHNDVHHITGLLYSVVGGEYPENVVRTVYLRRMVVHSE